MISIGRTVLVSRPSMRRPSLRIAPRTMSASRLLTSLDGDHLLLRVGFGERFGLALSRASLSAVERSDLSVSL